MPLFPGLRVLFLDSGDTGFSAVQDAIGRVGHEQRLERVTTRDEFERRRTEAFDLVLATEAGLADMPLPEVVQVLGLARGRIPLVVISRDGATRLEVARLPSTGDGHQLDVEHLAGQISEAVRIRFAVDEQPDDPASRAANQRETLPWRDACLEALFDHSPDGMLLSDDDGKLVEVNPAACALLGLGPEQLLGSSLTDVAPELTLQEGRAGRSGANATDASSGEYTRTGPDGVDRCVELRAVPNILPGLHLSILRDVTEHRRAERGLIEARRQADETARLKSDFLTHMSHEIRTPLTSIIGYSEVLAAEIEGEYRAFARLIEHSSKRLLNTLNSVLELSRLEAGRGDIQLVELDIRRPIEEVVEMLVARATAKGLELTVSLPPEPVHAFVDRAAVDRVLINLISNAIKFTSLGSVVVMAREANDWVEVDVSDTGAGIGADFVPLLFSEFSRETGPGIGRVEGSGLGLAITARLVDLMRGEIDVESVKGEGSTFTVRLRRAAPGAPCHDAESGPSDRVVGE